LGLLRDEQRFAEFFEEEGEVELEREVPFVDGREGEGEVEAVLEVVDEGLPMVAANLGSQPRF
jgi:hypothetical protein